MNIDEKVETIKNLLYQRTSPQFPEQIKIWYCWNSGRTQVQSHISPTPAPGTSKSAHYHNGASLISMMLQSGLSTNKIMSYKNNLWSTKRGHSTFLEGELTYYFPLQRAKKILLYSVNIKQLVHNTWGKWQFHNREKFLRLFSGVSLMNHWSQIPVHITLYCWLHEYILNIFPLTVEILSATSKKYNA